tara:strand:- start:111 stop:716 length:606 start_codon:yes stop_codon:yes gene_type:complete
MKSFLNLRSSLIIIFLLFINVSWSQEESKDKKNIEKNTKIKIPEGFPLAVIDMQAVLSRSTAAIELGKTMENTQKDYRKNLSETQNKLNVEKEDLEAQRAILAPEQFAEKENIFRNKVDEMQKKVADINRNLESTYARGMQVIQSEAVKQIAIISKEKGFLMVFDTKSVIIAAEQINISEIVAKKLNKVLPKLVEKPSEKN